MLASVSGVCECASAVVVHVTLHSRLISATLDLCVRKNNNKKEERGKNNVVAVVVVKVVVLLVPFSS